MADKHDDEKVGYKRPPKRTQFKKGQSGNPKGRPKKAMDIVSIVDRTLGETVAIREGDSLRHMSIKEATMFAQISKAMRGDQSAVAAIMKLADRHGLLAAKSTMSRNPIKVAGNAMSEEEWFEAARKQQAASKIASNRLLKSDEWLNE
jgi:hypothetical protein